MRLLGVFVLAAAFLHTTPGHGVEIAWIHLSVQHSYRDVSTACTAIRPGGDLYFAAELEGNRPMRVVLSNFPNEWPYTYIYKSVELRPDEVARIVLLRDAAGRAWIERLPLEGRLLRWILYFASEHYSYCPLPELLRTISPAPVTYEFETEGIKQGVLISYSQEIAFRGERLDGRPYTATMRLMQREYGE